MRHGDGDAAVTQNLRRARSHVKSLATLPIVKPNVNKYVILWLPRASFSHRSVKE